MAQIAVISEFQTGHAADMYVMPFSWYNTLLCAEGMLLLLVRARKSIATPEKKRMY